MQPNKLGYAEIYFGADIRRIVPKSIPGVWRRHDLDIPYIVQMKNFLDGKMNPKSVFFTRDGINKNDAINHLISVSNSFNLNYNDKLTIMSYLSSLWFKYVEILNN